MEEGSTHQEINQDDAAVEPYLPALELVFDDCKREHDGADLVLCPSGGVLLIIL